LHTLPKLREKKRERDSIEKKKIIVEEKWEKSGLSVLKGKSFRKTAYKNGVNKSESQGRGK
jgi:hypothetical protein